MKRKIKEINLNPSSDQPYYPGTKTYIPIGYTGGMINNADSSISRIMQTIETQEPEEEEDEMILNNRKKKNGKFDLLETLAENKLDKGFEEENLEEESFEEIDLEEFASITGGSIAGQTGPLGDEKRKNISSAEYLQKEQIERMRILEAYHQKTTSRLK